ncbi:type II toxin-antitoxin system RelE/ParE family toxin [Sphingopyxis alaskensis]|uniref:Plasmid stabilization system n=1 Tax=Sphingopyxis alaskensis (strain DSM 13593 / LMG 18877 / RB2256) TaxID=317655 RepID=Q1GPQ5_SPHAL|nr:type II toxin-antitoxin system RelE/ParE family toxin [Sphingopyxis alaskensis]ABF54367.1 plasmid stabilization system [Sphingopyxis alaskensis RB2256]MCM3417919.1 type II toxin-antitoxin system RelE/ParE family toxin [Sphingopyxis alaskensis]
MTAFRVSAIASRRLDEIFVYSLDTWGQEQAETYIRELFACFDRIARRELLWRAIPAEFSVDGYYCRHEHHYVYWRLLADGDVGIVTILHERMHQMDRFREDDGA